MEKHLETFICSFQIGRSALDIIKKLKGENLISNFFNLDQ